MARFLHFVTKLALVLCIGIAFPAATGAEDSGEAMNADGSKKIKYIYIYITSLHVFKNIILTCISANELASNACR